MPAASLALLTLLAPGLVPRAALAQVHPAPPPVAVAVRRSGPIVIDGRLDEPDWQRGVPAVDFRQSQPHEGEPATQRTEVHFVYDDDAIYVGARMYDTQGAAGIRTRLARRDQMPNADYVEILFDTFHDHLGRVMFGVNPSGVKEDWDGPNGAPLDSSWDAVWDVATHVDSLGWTAEFRIPLGQLRYRRDTVQTWGLEIWRNEGRLNEQSQWAFWRLDEYGGPARFGHLEGLHVTRGPDRGEVLPYVVGRSTNQPEIPRADPFTRSRATDARAGGDFTYLLSSSLTLAGSVNPDFGQVEVDPAVVNLSAFETYYPEKRPFFVEGNGLFAFGNMSCFLCINTSTVNLFYPRRIGRAPQGAADAAAAAGDRGFSLVPDNTTILGATKLTGTVGNAWTIAALDAATARETAQIQDSTGRRWTMEVEPFTNYFVGRVSRDLGGGNYVRAMVTSVVRDIRDSTLRSQLNAHSEAAGVETDLWWGKRTYHFMGNAVLTEVVGSPAAILGIQQASARYFQRPDRRNGTNGLFSDRYDSTLTALRGYALFGRLAKDGGPWQWEVAANVKSPGLEANDVAFNAQADRIFMVANLNRQVTKPNPIARQMTFIVGAQQAYDFGGDLVDRSVEAYAGLTLHNYWTVSAEYVHAFPRLSDSLAHGGPMLPLALLDGGLIQIQTDSRRAVVLAFTPDAECDDGRCSYDLVFSATTRPTTNTSFQLGPTYTHYATRYQYVTTVADPTDSAFFGRRYVFADLFERVLSMNLRLDWIFTPAVTLQLYAQPLIASAAYTSFKEYDRPRSFDRSVYGVDRGTIASANGAYTVDPDGAGAAAPFSFANPDFNTRSLRGSAILRWEYRPGSTIYVVWTQQRSASAATGDFRLGRDLRGLLGTPPDNIFLVKVTYRIGL